MLGGGPRPSSHTTIYSCLELTLSDMSNLFTATVMAVGVVLTLTVG